nr:tubulin-specific chaperone d [Quercus suber]
MFVTEVFSYHGEIARILTVVALAWLADQTIVFVTCSPHLPSSIISRRTATSVVRELEFVDTMDDGENDEELKLAKISAGLLTSLEASIPNLLWKPSKNDMDHGAVHNCIRKRELDSVIRLSEPQLLDSRLKFIVPQLLEAYVEWLAQEVTQPKRKHLPLQNALCTILYTLCKVRGYKVMVGFFNNEPRHLEPVLRAIERVCIEHESLEAGWQVEYILLLWLSHLLLTPFDLNSISTESPLSNCDLGELNLSPHVPSLAKRVISISLRCLSSASKTQDAAAALLVRLANRPDMQALCLADALVATMIQDIQTRQSDMQTTIHDHLGPLRVLAGVTASTDLTHLVPQIYQVSKVLASTGTSSASNAVAKKITLKIMRNIAIVTIRSPSVPERSSDSFDLTSVLEDVIDHLLRSIGDRDTPVRYAAAKAISLIIQELDADMGHEVLQAVLDIFKDDMPAHGDVLDFRVADALKWHGLTLTLAHALFKRTASPEQLPDMIRALSSALQFEQRTATGSSMGTNVRDAANFGIWALSRRYTTEELLAVDMDAVSLPSSSHSPHSIIQYLAIELILSACTDPAGNIRRGSSAALQELVGRHPNQVYQGISLVQIVDYQAVSLRRRAMVDVTHHAAALHTMYWRSLCRALHGWRGVGSTDVLSREAAAASLASLSLIQPVTEPRSLLSMVISVLGVTAMSDIEILHGLSSSLAHILEVVSQNSLAANTVTQFVEDLGSAWRSLESLQLTIKGFSSRTVRSELPTAVAQLLAALCNTTLQLADSVTWEEIPWKAAETITEHVLSRSEDTILDMIPSMVEALFALKQKAGVLPGCLAPQVLDEQVNADVSKSTLHGAGRAVALGALVSSYMNAARDEAFAVVQTLSSLIHASNVERRVVGVRALTLVVESAADGLHTNASIFQLICQATHQGMNDYTIDERGDIGSLVRLQAIACAHGIITAISKLEPNSTCDRATQSA